MRGQVRVGLWVVIVLLLSGCDREPPAPVVSLSAVRIAPASLSLAKGLSAKLSATAIYSNGTTANVTPQVAWTLASSSTATIDARTGLVTGIEVGTTTVHAVLDGVSSSAVSIVVGPAALSSIAVSPLSLAKGEDVQMTAMGTYTDGTTVDLTDKVSWASTFPATASVEANTGMVKALAKGNTEITAALEGVVSPAATVTVTPESLRRIAITLSTKVLAKGGSTRLLATGTYSDGKKKDITSKAVWKSGTPQVIRVTREPGVVTAIASGSGKVRASLGGIASNVAVLTVAASVGGRLNWLAAGNNITLMNNNTDKLTLRANGEFKFSDQLPPGAAFNVVIASAPANQNCTSLYGAGIMGTSDVSLLSIFCGMKSKSAPQWDSAGKLVTPRLSHTATLLPSGRVLVAGGEGVSHGLNSAELYDPDGGRWRATDKLATARQDHTATLLADGHVLVTGGEGRDGSLSSAELYDPDSGRWTGAGNMGTARQYHTATLLPDGRVLVVGGWNGTVVLVSAELYDPATGSWSATGDLSVARGSHTATLLADGRVLVAGGDNGTGFLASAEIYDPATGRWTAVGNLAKARYDHTATLLPNGRILVAGGYSENGYLASAELYDPATRHWSAAGNLAVGRGWHTATLLPTGRVLVAGGHGAKGYLTSAELYDPATHRWQTTDSLDMKRGWHTATLLPNGRVLVAGGWTGSGESVKTETYW